jgi:alpha 1,2-mannosyltransferase
VEDRFNNKFHYDWVFLNDKPFDDEFQRITSSLVSGTTHYGEIPPEHWSYPEWIDQERARQVREEMREQKIIYGHSESYRHMCRYESGFFFRHPLLQNYEYYWRVEPGVELFCDIPYDPFLFMKENDKKYSFVISMYEYPGTIPTLWDGVKQFMNDYPQHISEENLMRFLSDDKGKTYNSCHFVSTIPSRLLLELTHLIIWQWSNFEIGSLDWLRSKAYMDYFEALDRQGGFFYERWGDAPVHSIAAGLLLNKEQIHFWDEIAYYHMPFTHCPPDEQLRKDLRCSCDPYGNFDWKPHSCKPFRNIKQTLLNSTNLVPCLGLSRYFKANEIPLPAGVEEYSWLAIFGFVLLFANIACIVAVVINPGARAQARITVRGIYLQGQTLWERYQEEKREWERERLRMSR